MRSTIISASLCLTLLAGCTQRSAPAVPVNRAPQPVAGTLKADQQPVSDHYDCGKLITNVDLHTTGDWKQAYIGDCYVEWSPVWGALSFSISARPMQLTGSGRWQFAQLTVQPPEFLAVAVKGASANYTGALYQEAPEKTGAAFWGPTPWKLAVGGSAGLIAVGCGTVAPANDLAAGKQAQAQVDAACPGLLRAVTLGDIGAPVALEQP